MAPSVVTGAHAAHRAVTAPQQADALLIRRCTWNSARLSLINHAAARIMIFHFAHLLAPSLSSWRTILAAPRVRMCAAASIAGQGAWFWKRRFKEAAAAGEWLMIWAARCFWNAAFFSKNEGCWQFGEFEDLFVSRWWVLNWCFDFSYLFLYNFFTDLYKLYVFRSNFVDFACTYIHLYKNY